MAWLHTADDITYGTYGVLAGADMWQHECAVHEAISLLAIIGKGCEFESLNGLL